jgi:catechol 2,3-dioxygenase-like lactoylglutathione lyase family enzyme
MQHSLGALALLVRDYDEAIAWYTRCLAFELVADEPRGEGKRWVLLAPPGTGEKTCLLLARAATPEQQAGIGRQAGGRVFLFLQVDDFWARHAWMCANGVRFCETPREEPYATVAVFEDLYGNRWDLLQRR